MDAALLAVAVLGCVVALALPETRAEGVAGALRRTVFAPLTSLQVRAERMRRAIAEHDSVTAAGDSVAMQARDAAWLVKENARLRSLLDLRERLTWDHVAADALHAPPLGEPHTVLLAAGTDRGVRPFSPVITADGIVGYVRSADASTSIAIAWPHPDFRVSVTSLSGDAFGIVSAHEDAMGSRFLLELRGVPYRMPLDSGTVVVSSGFGGTFPRGIPVGTILRELPSESTWERSYLLVPAVRAHDVGSVLVLTAPRGSGDLRAVWDVADSAGVAQGGGR